MGPRIISLTAVMLKTAQPVLHTDNVARGGKLSFQNVGEGGQRCI